MAAYYSRIPYCRRTWLRKVYYEMKCLEGFGGRRTGNYVTVGCLLVCTLDSGTLTGGSGALGARSGIPGPRTTTGSATGRSFKPCADNRKGLESKVAFPEATIITYLAWPMLHCIFAAWSWCVLHAGPTLSTESAKSNSYGDDDA